MKTSYLAVLLIGIVAGIAGYLWIAQEGGWGGYAYVCADGTEFKVHPADDFSSIDITPTKNAVVFPERTLSSVESNVGKMFVGGSVVFFGQGEQVQLITTGASTLCQPKTSTEAPLNWGD
jgi:hypothetical protein